MSKIFPTFDEIKKGYCVYRKTGKFKGVSEFGEPIYAAVRSMEVCVAHNAFQKYVAIDIVLDRKYKEAGFRYGYEEKRRSRKYEYSESGYLKMLADIQKDLEYDARKIAALLDDLKGAKNESKIP